MTQPTPNQLIKELSSRRSTLVRLAKGSKLDGRDISTIRLLAEYGLAKTSPTPPSGERLTAERGEALAAIGSLGIRLIQNIDVLTRFLSGEEMNSGEMDAVADAVRYGIAIAKDWALSDDGLAVADEFERLGHASQGGGQ